MAIEREDKIDKKGDKIKMQMVENCTEQYKIVPNFVHKEKGIKNIRNSIDKLLKKSL